MRTKTNMKHFFFTYLQTYKNVYKKWKIKIFIKRGIKISNFKSEIIRDEKI